MSKFGNRKVTVDGINFDSRKEAHRWCELKYMEKAGLIQDLNRQVAYELIPAQRSEKTGKIIERSCKYIADFVYFNPSTKAIVVEDAKGMKTDVYKIKKKLMLWRYGIEIKEV